MADRKHRHQRRLAGPRWGVQVLVLLLVGGIVGYFCFNLNQNLLRQNLPFSFDFLDNRAGFAIGDAAVAYSSEDSVARALWVGLINTVRVAAISLVLTTILGVAIGIARLSDNWLVRQLALVYVEIFRNTPLVLQLLFLYFAFFLGLPQFEERVQWPGPIWFSNKGVVLPGLQVTTAMGVWGVCCGVGVIGAVVWRSQIRRQRSQGLIGRAGPWGILGLAVCVAVAIAQQPPLTVSWPEVVNEAQVMGGWQLSSEFATLTLGLTLYTAAFIAELVRAGITAVARGQWEAAQALGLRPGATLRLVVFPQALRVIVPPLISQYLNLAKNSSLAIATGYPDLYSVSSTIRNQTGRTIEILLLLMATYLSLSILISVIMNGYNRRIQLVER